MSKYWFAILVVLMIGYAIIANVIIALRNNRRAMAELESQLETVSEKLAGEPCPRCGSSDRGLDESGLAVECRSCGDSVNVIDKTEPINLEQKTVYSRWLADKLYGCRVPRMGPAEQTFWSLDLQLNRLRHQATGSQCPACGGVKVVHVTGPLVVTCEHCGAGQDLGEAVRPRNIYERKYYELWRKKRSALRPKRKNGG